MKCKGGHGGHQRLAGSLAVWSANTAIKRFGEVDPRGIGLWGSLLQETRKKYMCISHATLRMIKASVLLAFVKKGESLIFVS